MIAAVLLILAGVLIVLGALLCGFSKSGPQETLGGVIMMAGILAAMVGGLCWWAGL